MSASGWVWVTPLLAFGGALLGSGLSYRAAQKGTQQRESQGRREEWGRRFTGALGYLVVPESRGRDLGRRGAAVSKKTIKVTRDQVSAARAQIELCGTDKVDPLVLKIASVSPRIASRSTEFHREAAGQST
jgi:hypothetical protein